MNKYLCDGALCIYDEPVSGQNNKSTLDNEKDSYLPPIIEDLGNPQDHSLRAKRGRPRVRVTAREVRGLRERGLSIRKIAASLKISSTSVWRLLRDMPTQ